MIENANNKAQLLFGGKKNPLHRYSTKWNHPLALSAFFAAVSCEKNKRDQSSKASA